jgi:hypothetical protein
MKIKEIIQQKSMEILLLAISGVIGYLLAIVWKEISLPFVQKPLPELSKTALLAIILIQFLALIGTLVYILLTRNKSRHYRFDKHLGISFHKKTGEPFCPTCLLSNVVSPLMEFESGWRCQRKECNKPFSNPNYKAPPGIPPGAWT